MPSCEDLFTLLPPNPPDNFSLNGDTYSNGNHLTNGQHLTNGNSLSNGHTYSSSPEMPITPSNEDGPRTTASSAAAVSTTTTRRPLVVHNSSSYYEDRISILEQRCEQERSSWAREKLVLLARIKELEVGSAPAAPETPTTAPSTSSAHNFLEGPGPQVVPTPTRRFPSDPSKEQLETIPEDEKPSSTLPLATDGTVSGIDSPTPAQHPHLPTGTVSNIGNQLDEDPALKGPLGLGKDQERDKAFLSGVQSKLQEEQQTHASPSSEASPSVPRSPRLHESPDSEPKIKFKKSLNFGTQFGSARLDPDFK
ncbi:MAG: hypothetical protein M1836_005691 [Candelina mexicana]|nr:MAG: hypothetical protein M1836_005691 [Candelina mexicana]